MSPNMSLCIIKSAQKVGNSLASRTSTSGARIPPWTTTRNFTAARCRWNSSNSAAGGARIPLLRSRTKTKTGGWATWKVLSLATATGILAHVLATNDAKSRRAKDREYSNPGKFLEPQYATIQDMETVTIGSVSNSNKTCTKRFVGYQRNSSSNRRPRYNLT